MQRQNTPKAVQDCHDLLEWLIPHLDKLPRVRRFTLGERIETGLLEVLERLIEAAYSRSKSESLRQANLKLDVVRHLWRLCYRLKAIPMKRYAHGAKLFESLGRQSTDLRHARRRQRSGLPGFPDASTPPQRQWLSFSASPAWLGKTLCPP
jgi:hypothetical protein